MKDMSFGSLRLQIVRLLTCVLLACLAVGLSSCSCSKQESMAGDNTSFVLNDSPEPEKTADNLETWPLTGLKLNEGDDPGRRPLSVKIENTPVARPQLGISHADIIYESVTEGGITRFNCIFQSDIPVEFGPVRSARNSDVSIAPQYKALFFYSGANSTVNREIRDAKIPNMGHTPAAELYYRVAYREAPHNLYVKTEGVYGVAERLKFKVVLDVPQGLQFGPSDISSAPAATNINVPLSDYYVADWAFDSAQGHYVRSMDGASTDAESDQPLVANNVIILWASHTQGVVANGSQTYNIDLTTNGNASIFMGGKRIDGTWEATATTPPRFKDANGQEILLTPGKTWFEVVDTPVVVTSS